MSEALTRIRAILTTTPLRWSQLTETTPDDLLRQRPAPAEWSALECLQHIVDTERLVFPPRLEALRQARDIPAFDPDQQGSHDTSDHTPAALAATFAQLRATNLAALAEVGEDEFGQSGVHSEIGRVTLGQLLHEWAAHDLDHTMLAGDALTATDGRLQGPNPAATPNIAQAGQSVQTLAALDVATIVCYHGGVVQDDAHGQLQRVAAEMAASLASP